MHVSRKRASFIYCATRAMLQHRYWQPPDVKEARRVWTKAFQVGLVPRRHYLEGLVLLTVYHFRGGGRLASIVQRGWPSQLFQSGSSTSFLKTPVSVVRDPVDAILSG
jgi:hypothetical protein